MTATAIDHTACQGQCGATLCCCRPLDGDRCPGTVAQACGHLRPLCPSCAVLDCDECLREALPATWFGGEAR